MPEIYVYMLEGRTEKQKRTLVTEITEAMVRAIDVDPEAVVIQFIETPTTSKAKGGVLFSERGGAQGKRQQSK